MKHLIPYICLSTALWFLPLACSDQLAAEKIVSLVLGESEELPENPTRQIWQSTEKEVWAPRASGRKLWEGDTLTAQTGLPFVPASQEFQHQSSQDWPTQQEDNWSHKSPDRQAWDRLILERNALWHRLNNTLYLMHRLFNDGNFLQKRLATITADLEESNKTIQKQSFEKERLIHKLVMLELERNFATKERDQLAREKDQLVLDRTQALEQKTALEKKGESLEGSLIKSITKEKDAAVAKIALLEAAKKHTMKTHATAYRLWATASYTRRASSMPEAGKKQSGEKKTHSTATGTSTTAIAPTSRSAYAFIRKTTSMPIQARADLSHLQPVYQCAASRSNRRKAQQRKNSHQSRADSANNWRNLAE